MSTAKFFAVLLSHIILKCAFTFVLVLVRARVCLSAWPLFAYNLCDGLLSVSRFSSGRFLLAAARPAHKATNVLDILHARSSNENVGYE